MLDPITSHLFRDAGRNGPLMLMYHSVESGKARVLWPWSVSLDLFASHLDFLRDHGWSTCTIAELIQTPAENLPVKTVVITFDDGFANNLGAVDALVSRGMCGSWFIVTGAIGKVPHWEGIDRPQGCMLSQQNLRDMRSTGMEIGSHGVNHVRLPPLSDRELHHEITSSKARLEQILGESIDGFAYPYGAWDQRCERAVYESGYRYACTTRTGAALKDNNSMRLRRLSVLNGDSVARLARKMAFLSNEGAWGDAVSWCSKRIVGRVSRKSKLN